MTVDGSWDRIEILSTIIVMTIIIILKGLL